MNEQYKSLFKWIIPVAIVFTLLVALLAFHPWVVISAGEKGVVLNWGAIDENVLEDGIHWRVPFKQRVIKVDVTKQKIETNASAASKDLQDVNATVALNYRLDSTAVNLLWKRFRGTQQVTVIDPAIQEAVKSATAKFTAEELITKRETVKDAIKLALADRLKTDFILVDDISITNFSFSKAFSDAIEAKQTAVQTALKAKNDLEKVKFEAEQQISKAKAEAETIRLASQAANNDKYVDLKRLEVQLEMAKKWNGVLPVNLYGSAPIPFLNLTK